MPDVILQGCGSMEAWSDFCFLNGVSITDVPVIGTVYMVPVSANSDPTVLQYLMQRSIVIGTLADMPPVTEMPLLNDDTTPLLNDDGTPLFSDN